MCQTSLIELRAVNKSVTDRLTDTIVKCIVRRSHLVGVELNFYISFPRQFPTLIFPSFALVRNKLGVNLK